MKNSTGVVMQLDKRYAVVMTSSGQFLKLKIGRNKPAVGEVFTGEVAKATPFYKYAAAAASLAFVLFSGTATYAYYTPTASVTVDINPSIELKLNRWNRIIKAIPLNSDGEKVLSSITINHKPVNDGLDSIVAEAKKDNFINDDYIQSGKVIKVSIDSDNPDKQFNLSEFKEYTKKNNLNVDIINESTDKKAAPKKIENAQPSNPSVNPGKSEDDKNNKPNNNDDKFTSPSNNGNSSNGSDKSKENKNTDNKNKNKESSSIGSIISNFIGAGFNTNRESNNDQSKQPWKNNKNKADNKDNDNKEKDNPGKKK